MTISCLIAIALLLNLVSANVISAGADGSPTSSIAIDARGERLLFSTTRWNDNGEIVIVNLDTLDEWTRLTHDEAVDSVPVFAPDGRSIVFASIRDGNADLYSTTTDGHMTKRLTSSLLVDRTPAFSPDGQRIFFSRQMDSDPKYWMQSELFVMNADGSSVKQLTHNDDAEWKPRLFPDGQRVVYEKISVSSGGESGIWVMNKDGSSQRQLVSNAADPAVSGDGKAIAFVSDRAQAFEYEVYVASADGSNVRRLTQNHGYNSSPIFVPGTDRLLFLHRPKGTAGGTPTVCEVHLNTVRVTELFSTK